MKKTISNLTKFHEPTYRIAKSIYTYFKKRKYLKYNTNNDLEFNEKLFSSLEIDIKFIKSTLQKNGLNYEDQDLSWHYHLFAGLKNKFENENIKIEQILEIGTFNGLFTNFLSEIFPDSMIISIDLNENDNSFTTSYDREDSKKLINFLEVRKQNLDKKNIEFIPMTSLDLLKKFKKESFDLIWIDGDHLNPQVTIDIFQCLHLVKKNGVICVDDVVKDNKILKNNVNQGYISEDSFKMIEYLNNLNYLNTSYLLKRVRNRNLDGKKFISISSIKDLS